MWEWIARRTGIRLSREQICPGHSSPWRIFCDLFFLRPELVLIHGPRGGGKSFLTALDTHLSSCLRAGQSTRILGGSLSQSAQVFQAMRRFARDSDPDLFTSGGTISSLTKSNASYANGSEVGILAASSKSVRGPHVASLKLDEVDEIDSELREAAMGMCMEVNQIPPSIVMTSTWHRTAGPMSALLEQAREGAFPSYSFCVFEVLERCPDERSGANNENCPRCPLFRYCHDQTDGGPPKAKRSNGHYSIDSLIQKIKATSLRTFESDYLCLGPRAEGVWFSSFQRSLHVDPAAEYNPKLAVELAVDTGVYTGAIFFQIVERAGNDNEQGEEILIFADYLAENRSAEMNARAILELSRARCGGHISRVTTDPSGDYRNAVGPTVFSEYQRAGLSKLEPWPLGSVASGLALIDSFLQPAEGPPRLRIHPRCEALISALENYRRKKRGGQWLDSPEDPQHPHEDLVDSLRGGLLACFPEGRDRRPQLPRISARQVF